MGTYYRYVNFTRREFVSLGDLRDGGDKENAALYCAPALAYLLLWPYACGDGYRGRWQSYESTAPAHDVRIVADSVYDFYDMEEDGFLNITPGLLQSMRRERPGLVADYQPRVHDVELSVHAEHVTHTLLEAVSTSCKCGWTVGPIHGDNRDETLVQIVSDHVNSKKERSPQREPRPFVYRAELSSDDVCDLIDALVAITSDTQPQGVHVRARALRDRLASLPGTRK